MEVGVEAAVLTMEAMVMSMADYGGNGAERGCVGSWYQIGRSEIEAIEVGVMVSGREVVEMIGIGYGGGEHEGKQ